MNLDDVKKQKITEWIGQGLKLSEIQTKLASELDTPLTYMEVRLLVDELKLVPKDQPARQPPPKLSVPGKTDPSPDLQGGVEELPEEQGGETAPGSVSISVDQVARPGALVSGNVTFSDGNSAAWYLDQLGRLGILPKQTGYRPSQQDLQVFQIELQNQLQKMGL